MKKLFLLILFLPMAAIANGSLFGQDQGQLQGQAQGQLQGQGQGQYQGQKSYNRNYNTNLQGQSLYNKQDLTSVSGSYSGSKAKAGAAAGAKSGSSSNNSFTYTEAAIPDKTYHKAVVRNNPDIVAPNLTTSNGTCMGSSSVGASGAAIGATFGTTWSDEECNLRYNATHLHNMGYTSAAVQVMCQMDSVKLAMAISNPGVCGDEPVTIGSTGGGSKSSKSFDNGFFVTN